MDRINVTENGLANAEAALVRLNERIAEATKGCISQIEASYGDIDEDFAHVLERFIEVMKRMDGRVSVFASENTSALRKRLEVLINEYVKQEYKKQDIK